MHSNPMLVKVAPVKSKEGVTYTNVSVTNLQYILDNELKIGSPIAFDLRSMAAPVLNSYVTEQLQQQYVGKWDEYHAMIDSL